MKNKLLFLKSKMILFISVLFLLSIQVQGSNQILLKSGTLITESNFSEKANQAPLLNEIYNGNYYRLIQFEKLPSSADKMAIELSGVKLLGYIPFNAFYISIPIHYNLQQLSKYSVRTILKIDINSKLSLRLRENDIPDHAKKGSNVDLIVQYFKNLTFSTVSENLISKGCEIINNFKETQIITIRTAENNWKNIAELPYIKFVQPIDDKPTPDDIKGRSLHRTNVIDSDYPMGRHYDGSGVSIALADDGFVGPHIDFSGRITQFTSVLPGSSGSHGDMTSGIAVGAGNRDPKIKGMASGAHIYIYDYVTYPQIVDAALNLATYGTVVTSTSYSQGCNTYDVNAQLGDQIMNQLKVVLPVFSAGNNNGANCGYGAGTQWGNITGGYKQGKNVIAVANLDAFQVIDNTSSHGPAEDGRIKPDISANGKDQLSTAEDNTTQTGGGTSAACPGIAGVCAQLYQAYRELTGQPNPDAALIKACLLNSAEDIGVAGPDFFYGYGRVNALGAVKTLEDMRYTNDSVLNGITNTHIINVPPGTKKVRVMVLWNDVEGDPVATRALVNDLNISLTDPSSLSFNPWVLNPAPVATTLDDPAIRSIDSLNNMEQITINDPIPGVYTLSVEGHSVPFGPQKYFLVYQFDQDEIVVTYPNGGEGFVPVENELLRWDANNKMGNYTIEYSVDSGTIWNSITSVGGTIRQFNWTIPATVSSKALVRITNGSISAQSPHTFSIIGVPQNLSLVWACPDSLKLTWNAVTGADYYEVSKLGQFYMDSVGVSTTNSIVVSTINLNDTNWFSVKAVTGAGKGRRATAIIKLPGLVNCPSAIDAQIIAQNPGNDLAYECDSLTNYPVNITLKNSGIPVINNFDISYQLDSDSIVTQTLNTPIPSGSTSTISFIPTIDISSAGNHTLKSWITYPGDVNPSNDTLISIFVSSPSFVAPIAETFQAALFPPSNWLVLQSNTTYTWALSDSITGSGGVATTSAWFDNYSYNGIGSIDKLTTELIDIGAMTQPEFSFDVAYAKFQNFEDELQVEISTDCGLTFVPTGYSKKGANLASAGTSNTDWKPTAASQWRKDVIDLTPYIGSSGVILRFLNINGFGNNLYVDNVNVSDGPLGSKSIASVENVTIYPNPSAGIFNFNLIDLAGKKAKIEVFDAKGMSVYLTEVNNPGNNFKGSVDLQNYPKGVYLFKVTSGDRSYFQKLVIM